MRSRVGAFGRRIFVDRLLLWLFLCLLDLDGAEEAEDAPGLRGLRAADAVRAADPSPSATRSANDSRVKILMVEWTLVSALRRLAPITAPLIIA